MTALVAGAVVGRTGRTDRGGDGRASLAASFSAAYRAFRDPSLLDAPRASAPSASRGSESCLEGRGEVRVADERSLDTDLSLEKPGAHGERDDLDDADGTAIRDLALPDLHTPVTRRTMRVVRYLTRDPRGRALFLQRFRRASLYRESIAFNLREAGLPEDLLWLSAVESGFDPRALSPAGAAGLWQMMPATAQLYGLDQSSFVDERRSIGRSTHAAVTHLRDLFERFHRWDLAMAAYNAGYDRIASAIEKVATDRHGDPINVTFGDLAAARAIPHETIEYVPQIMAFALVAANRTRFGLDAPELGPEGRGLELGEIAVPEGTRLRTVARAAGISVAVLRDYNPQLLRDRVPPVGGDYLIALPEARVQRALASFPSYADQEIVARDDEDTSASSAPEKANGSSGHDRTLTLASAGGAGSEEEDDEPLPRRPSPLGKNRLPELVVRRDTRDAQWMLTLGALPDMKLPTSLASPDAAWQRQDHVGAFFGAEPSAFPLMPGGYKAQTLDGPATRDAAIEAQLGFLHSAEALKSFALPNGVSLRVRRDAGASSVSVTVRVATVETESSGRGAEKGGAELGSGETIHTITVDRADADAAIELGAARLRLLMGDAGASQTAEIRAHAGAARRKTLQETPYGASWLALGDALFPPDHPLAGTVLGASEDEASLRDLAIAESLGREHDAARGSLTISGEIDETHAKKLAEALLGQVRSVGARGLTRDARGEPGVNAMTVHPREDQLTVDDRVSAPRVLVGWLGPAEGEIGDASLRVAFEILDGKQTSVLARSLVDGARAAKDAHAKLEIGTRASVATIEVTPAANGKDAHDTHGTSAIRSTLAALDAEIEKLAEEGPSGNDVAMAKWVLHARLTKASEAAASAAKRASEKAGDKTRDKAGEVHSPGLAELKRALRPWANAHALKSLDEVTPATVRAAIRHVLSPSHRVVVVTVPR